MEMNQKRVGILCCPKCQSSMLSIAAITNYHQTDEGDWEIEELEQEDLRDGLLVKYAEVRCENPKCGTPYLDGQPLLDMQPNEDLYAYWLRTHRLDFVPLQELEDGIREQFIEFEKNVVYMDSFEGTVADCIELDR